ncbi:hypothetical protein P691DRAFT_782066 [Macrolepiota fuliginosa MF-IS2]|uniref:Uncharacterized protein n=1 Tax=Macrolepiota fuliginosa MF-IS2 TaxID=1400762 RepID=A0A9P5XNW5_9AGAR|nr:hypothetical protein P691DRAFT_782066 [Macrolepiota fuliginosa MF-IS2]
MPTTLPPAYPPPTLRGLVFFLSYLESSHKTSHDACLVTNFDYRLHYHAALRTRTRQQESVHGSDYSQAELNWHTPPQLPAPTLPPYGQISRQLVISMGSATGPDPARLFAAFSIVDTSLYVLPLPLTTTIPPRRALATRLGRLVCTRDHAAFRERLVRAGP